MENAWIYVYIWSIWNSVLTLVATIVIAGGFYHALLLLAGLADNGDLMYFRDKLWLKTFTFMVLLLTFLPNKSSMLLIISANPVANTVIESYENGKLDKLNKLTDLALDKALEELKDKE